jgi:hypothetical protein
MRPSDRTFRNAPISTSFSVPGCATGASPLRRWAEARFAASPGTNIARGISLSEPPPALILGDIRAQAFAEFAVVQAFEQPAVACPGFLTPPIMVTAQVAQNSKTLKWLPEKHRMEQRVLHRGAWAAGLKEFPSVPM